MTPTRFPGSKPRKGVVTTDTQPFQRFLTLEEVVLPDSRFPDLKPQKRLQKKFYLYRKFVVKIETLEAGNYYHIYNRGNNGSKIFFEDENYQHFLRLYKKYIPPIADTFAWCLMQNHFHFLVYIKQDEEIYKEDYLKLPGRESKKPIASRQFGHLFNAYVQAINKKYKRTGSLLEKPFERKKVTSEDYLKKLIFYIHNNPVHIQLLKIFLHIPGLPIRSSIQNKSL